MSTLNYRSSDGQRAEAVAGVGGAIATIDGGPGIAVTPTVSAVPTAVKNLDAGTSQVVLGFRATAGAGDDATAAERLANVFPGVAQVGPDNVLVMNLDTAVSRVDVVGIGDATAGGVMLLTGSSANAAAQLTTFDFSTPVQRVVISCTPRFDSDSQAQLTVEGYRYG